MPVELIYDSSDEVNLTDGSYYFSDFSQVLIAVKNSTVFVGAYLQVTVILELLFASSWMRFEMFKKKYPIVDNTQNILLSSDIPGTQSPTSRNKLLVRLSDPGASLIKIYVF